MSKISTVRSFPRKTPTAIRAQITRGGKKARVGSGDKLRSFQRIGVVLNERGKRPIEDLQMMSTMAKTNSSSSISLSNGSTRLSASLHILTNAL